MTIATAGVALLGVFLSSWPLAIIGGAAFLGTLLFLSAKESQSRPEMRRSYDLSNENRTLIRPLEEIRKQIEAVVEQNRDMATVSVIGQEALTEADSIIEHGLKLLENRSQLKKTLRGRSEAEASLKQLQTNLASATSDTERGALESAIASRTAEIKSYSRVEQLIELIDGKMNEAVAALSELKAHLATGAAGARADAMAPEQLSEMVSRLKSLGKSFDEAESTLEMHNT